MPSLFQNDHAFSMRRISASGPSARNTALPATSTSAPASKSSRAFADEMPPSTIDKRIEPHAAFHLRQTTHLLHRRWYERLPPEPGLDAHHQHHLHLRQQPLQHPRHPLSALTRFRHTLRRHVWPRCRHNVVRRLIVKGDIPGPRLDKACDVTHRIGYHQMHVERLGRGAAVWPSSRGIRTICWARTPHP